MHRRRWQTSPQASRSPTLHGGLRGPDWRPYPLGQSPYRWFGLLRRQAWSLPRFVTSPSRRSGSEFGPSTSFTMTGRQLSVYTGVSSDSTRGSSMGIVAGQDNGVAVPSFPERVDDGCHQAQHSARPLELHQGRPIAVEAGRTLPDGSGTQLSAASHSRRPCIPAGTPGSGFAVKVVRILGRATGLSRGRELFLSPGCS